MVRNKDKNLNTSLTYSQTEFHSWLLRSPSPQATQMANGGYSQYLAAPEWDLSMAYTPSGTGWTALALP